MQRISQRVLRASLSGALLALLVLLTFNVGTTYADACGGLTATPLDAGTSCDMAIPSIQSTPGPLAYTADAILAITSGATSDGATPPSYTYVYDGTDHNFGISFHTTVSDHRGGLTGWNLSASATITSPATITLGTSTATTGTGITNGCTSTCSPAFTSLTKGTPVLNSGSSKPFIGALTILSGGPNLGDYAITTPGTLTIPGSVRPSTPISGTITLTLNDAVGTFVA